MADPATWYLVVQRASSLVAHGNEVFQGPPPLVGPITESQCLQTRDSLAPLPGVVMARCRRAVGMMTHSSGPVGYAYPIFDGDGYVSVGSVK